MWLWKWSQCFSSLLQYLKRSGDLLTSVLPLNLSARQMLVAYVTKWWQCFISLVPAMLWRPTYFGASAYSARQMLVAYVSNGGTALHLTSTCNALPTYLLRCFRLLSQHGKCWWPMYQNGGSASSTYLQCSGDLLTSALLLTSAYALSTANLGGLRVRMVAVLHLTSTCNALATYLLRRFRLHPLTLSARQILVAYVSKWWQCFVSLVPEMLWRPTCLPASVCSLSTANVGGLPVKMVAALHLRTCNALATYLLQCAYSLSTANLGGLRVKMVVALHLTIVPAMIWRPTYFSASAYLSTANVGGLCIKIVAVLHLRTCNALAIYLLWCFRLHLLAALPLTSAYTLSARQILVAYVSKWWQCFSSLVPAMLWRPIACFRLLSQHGQCWWPTCQNGGSAPSH